MPTAKDAAWSAAVPFATATASAAPSASNSSQWNTVSTTAPEWLSKELRISFTGSTLLAAGDYEDILTITISAK